MTSLFKLAIVGRPNVGKSALFNCICRRRIAIVDEAEGVTRDRLYAEGEAFGVPFLVIDTGGIQHNRSKLPFYQEVRQQTQLAIDEADSLIMVVDGQTGATELDLEVARLLLQANKPICLAVNKIDSPDQEFLLAPFYALGIKRIIGVSASHRWRIAELLESALLDRPSSLPNDAALEKSTRIAIVGRPNVGKSSLVNYLLGDSKRCIVSPIPGTTRDSIDVEFLYEEERYTLVDTAGIRRKHAEHEVVDKFAAIRTERAIERADVCLLMLTASEGISTQDKKIANTIEEAGKGCVLLFNKWDLVKGFRMEKCLQSLEAEVPFLKHCPKLFLSAKTGRNVEKVFPLIQQVQQSCTMRIPTHQLNKVVESAQQKSHPPMIQGKRLRIYYLTQIEIQPPQFVLFVNNPRLMTETYRKYLLNQLREAYEFLGAPIRLYLKGKRRDEVE